jgi:hypothetical protein
MLKYNNRITFKKTIILELTLLIYISISIYLNTVILRKNLYMTRPIEMDPLRHAVQQLMWMYFTVYKRLMTVANDWNI